MTEKTEINRKTTFSLPVVAMLLGIAVMFVSLVVNMEYVKEDIRELKVAVASLINPVTVALK